MDYVLVLILLHYKANILVVETSFNDSNLSFKIEYFAGLENQINQKSKKETKFICEEKKKIQIEKRKFLLPINQNALFKH